MEQYECTKCYEVFNGKDECTEHTKEKHYSFKLRGTDLILVLKEGKL